MSDPKAKGAGTGIVAKQDTVVRMLDKSWPTIEAAIPKHLTPARMLRIARTAIRANPTLMECPPETILESIVEASVLGLECDGALGQAYLVPFYNKKTRRKECQFLPGYKGLEKLAYQAAGVIIDTDIICENDEYRWEKGTSPSLKHRPRLDGDRGEVIAVYATASFPDGRYRFDIMAPAEIEEVRNGSQAKDGPAWRNHWAEMAKKTVIRRLCKHLSLSPELTRAAMVDEYAEAGVRPKPMVIDVEPVEPGPEPAEPDPDDERKPEGERTMDLVDGCQVCGRGLMGKEKEVCDECRSDIEEAEKRG